MTHISRPLAAVVALGALAGIGASSAGAATVHPTPVVAKAPATTQSYIHQTTGAPTKAAALKAERAFAKTVSHPILGAPALSMTGWVADVTYTASAPKAANDPLSTDMWAGEIVIAHHEHGAYTFKTKAEANAHMLWAAQHLDKNKYVVTATSLSKSANGSWVESVTYDGISAPAFAGDTSWAVA